MKPTISLIVAVAQNGIIGTGGTMPWHITEDFRHFKAVTSGHSVIMGRKTYESIGRPLPNRRNIVLSRQEGLHYENAECYRSLEDALMQCDYTEDVYIIGGGELYKQTLDLAKRVHLTLVDDIPAEADAFFPELNPDEWTEALREEHPADEKHAQAYSFIDYVRK